jgi:hypothetical protein
VAQLFSSHQRLLYQRALREPQAEGIAWGYVGHSD